MADKLSKEGVQVALTDLLTQFSERIAEVVDDYRAFVKENIHDNDKDRFARSCMNDVVTLTGNLTQFVHETLIAAGVDTTPPPSVSSEADVIDLQLYREAGGLLH